MAKGTRVAMNRIVIGRVPVACLLLAVLACGRLGDAPEAAMDEAADPETENARMSQAQHDRRIDYIEFPATNIEATKAFYSAVFGWTFTDYGPEYTSFEDGRLAGGFALASEVTAGGPLVVLYATDLEAMETKVTQHGGRIVREIFEFRGGRRFHFADPSGNELAVWSDR